MRINEDFRDTYNLLDGRKVELRLVRPGDEDAFIEGLIRCSDRTIYNRFMGTKPRFSAAELHYLTHCDINDHVGIIGLLEEELVAVGRAVRYKHRPDAADFGIIVRDEFQKHGLGKYLLELLVEALRERDIRFLCGEMFATNAAMFRIVDDFPFLTDWILDGSTASFEVDLSSRK